MSERPRFSLRLTLYDRFGQPLSMEVGLDKEVRISTRVVGEMKMAAECGIGMLTMDDALTVMKTKELRKDLFVAAAQQLARQMAERMEDAEGWHDASRIDPARKQLGGEWS